MSTSTSQASPNQGADFGVTDPKTQTILTKATFRLSDRQAEGVVEYISFSSRALPERLCQIVPGLEVRRMHRKDFGHVGAAQCDLGHQVRYLWFLITGAEDEATSEVRRFGSTCAFHAMGLTPAEITLVKSLDRWTGDLAKRELLRTLGEGNRNGRDGAEIWDRYKASPTYDRLVKALDKVRGSEERAVSYLPPTNPTTAQERRLLQALGRICTAVQTADYLLDHELPVPSKFRQWIERAAVRIARSSRRSRPAAQGRVAAQAAAVISSMPAVMQAEPDTGIMVDPDQLIPAAAADQGQATPTGGLTALAAAQNQGSLFEIAGQ